VADASRPLALVMGFGLLRSGGGATRSSEADTVPMSAKGGRLRPAGRKSADHHVVPLGRALFGGCGVRLPRRPSIIRGMRQHSNRVALTRRFAPGGRFSADTVVPRSPTQIARAAHAARRRVVNNAPSARQFDNAHAPLRAALDLILNLPPADPWGEAAAGRFAQLPVGYASA